MMQHITGIARNQMVFTNLEDPISQDNPVRFVDAFVESMDLKALGFEVQ
ncbi:transposase, partial [Chryseobacterium sp. 16F]|nr:transposase [Frigoriflavimonas asaccharolytica]